MKTHLIIAAAVVLLAIAIIAFSPGDMDDKPKSTAAAALAREDGLALLAKHYPAAKTNAREEVTIIRTADGFEPRFGGKLEPQINVPGSRWKNPAKAVLPKFPKQFNNPMSVSSTFDAPRSTGVPPVSSSSGRSLASPRVTYAASAVPLNANAQSTGEIAADGTLLYKDAFGAGIDVIYRVQPLKTEEFIVIHERANNQSPARQQGVESAKTRSFSWNLNLGEGAAALKPRLTPMHTIELCDDKGVPRLRIDLPEGKDANGTRLNAGKELRYTIEGERLTLAADLSNAKFPVVIDPSWSSTGAMAVPRIRHSLTPLQDGRLISIGGMSVSTQYLASCEIFNPQSGSWSAGNPLALGRRGHTATLLNNGNVLVVAGENSTGNYVSCELFNIGNENWTAAAPLTNGRYYHTATLLGSGDVVIIGGTSGACEKYDAINGIWSGAGSLLVTRSGNHQSVLLASGKILVIGGGDELGPCLSACELYNPGTGISVNANPLVVPRTSFTATLLDDGNVFVAGGFNGISNTISCEYFNSTDGTWSEESGMSPGRRNHSATLLSGGKVLVVGGVDDDTNGLKEVFLFNSSNLQIYSAADVLSARSRHLAAPLSDTRILVDGATTSNCVIYDPRPVAAPVSISTRYDIPVIIGLSADSIGNSLSFGIATNPTHGVLSGTAPNMTYTPSAGYVGNDSFTYTATDSIGQSASALVTINVTNQNPELIVDASPAAAKPGETIIFTLIGTDPEGDALTYSLNFGDGSGFTDQTTVSHIYSVPGTFEVTVSAADLHGGQTVVTMFVVISNSGDGGGIPAGDNPVARMVTSEIVGFVGVPLAFDAIFSTDPNNDIVAYTWDFGDGSPVGSGQAISKIYTSTGSFVVLLTVIDGAGNKDYAIRTIEVLGADQVGLFNGFVTYKARWDRDKESKDTLQLTAQVNVGEQTLGAGTVVSLDIVGQHFEGTLDLKLRDKTDPNDGWQVKANLRKQPFGTVQLKVKIKNADLGLGFNQAGAVKGAEPSDIVDADIPVRITIGGRSFELNVASEFKFNSSGKRAKGEGDE